MSSDIVWVENIQWPDLSVLCDKIFQVLDKHVERQNKEYLSSLANCDSESDTEITTEKQNTFFQ